MDDYLNWVNSRARQDNFEMLAKNVKKITVKKESLDLDLAELEAAAKLVLAEESDVSGNLNLLIEDEVDKINIFVLCHNLFFVIWFPFCSDRSIGFKYCGIIVNLS